MRQYLVVSEAGGVAVSGFGAGVHFTFTAEHCEFQNFLLTLLPSPIPSYSQLIAVVFSAMDSSDSSCQRQIECLSEPLPTSEVPGSLLLQEQGYPEYLDTDVNRRYPLAPIHADLRGRDRPDMTDMRKLQRLDRTAQSMIRITKHDGAVETYGWPSHEAPADAEVGKTDPRWIKTKLLAKPNSPSIEILINEPRTYRQTTSSNDQGIAKQANKRKGKGEANEQRRQGPGTGTKSQADYWHCIIFANSIERQSHEIEFRVDFPGETSEEYLPQVIHDLSENNRLCSIYMFLESRDSTKTDGARGPPIFLKNTNHEYNFRTEDLEAYRQDPASLQHRPVTQLLCALYDARLVRIYRTVDQQDVPEDMARMQHYVAVLNSAMYVTALKGNYWYYRERLGAIQGSSNALKYLAVPPPRWLVKQWRIPYDKNDEAMSLLPYTCSELEPDQQGPDLGSRSILFELTATRDHADMLKTIGSYIRPLGPGVENEVRARFMNMPETPQHKVIFLYFLGLDDLQKGQRKLPGIDIQVIIEVEVTSSDEQTKRLKYAGSTTYDVFRTTSHLVILGTGPEHEFDEDKAYIVSMEWDKDEKSLARKINANRKLSTKAPPKDGPYFPKWIFGVPQPADQQPGFLSAQKETDVDGRLFRDIYNSVLQSHSLNVGQMEAGQAVMSNTDGMLIIQGPPGTGKSQLSVAVLDALAQCKVKVLTTSPTNAGVRAIVKKLKTTTTDGIREFEWVHLTSATSRNSPRVQDVIDRIENIQIEDVSDVDMPDAPTTIAQADDTIATPHSDTLTERDLAFSFWSDEFEQKLVSEIADGIAYKLIAACNAWSRDIHSPHHGLAKAAENTRLAFEAGKNGPQHVHLVAAKDKASVAFEQAFVSQLKLVVCTNNTAGSEVVEYFQPTVLLMDEAGLSTPLDSMVPMATAINSIKQMILVGDNKQLKPFIVESESNEAMAVNTVSIFEKESNSGRCDTVRLKETYRMHPQLTKWPSNQYYDGSIFNAPITSQPRPGDIFLKDAFQSLFTPWNGRRRICLDVPPSEARSELFEGSSSRMNDIEAVVLTQLLDRLLERADVVRDHGEAGADILEPEQIMALTPYKGQVRVIKQKIGTHPRLREVKDEIDVFTVGSVEGSENTLVVVSLVSNVPGQPMDLGFVAKDANLNVAMTRASSYLVILGNFTGWMRELRMHSTYPGTPGPLIGSDRKAFKSLLEDIYRHDDVLSWDVHQAGLKSRPVPPNRFKQNVGRGRLP